MTTMTQLPRFARTACLLLVATALAACGGGNADPSSRDADGNAAPLPRPQEGAGAVTDMPAKPGPGEVPIGGEPPLPQLPLPDADVFAMPQPTDNPESGLAQAPPAAPGEPTVEDAVAVVRQYYAAIAARDFAQAYALWSDGGRSSGQTLAQFSAGFAQTASVQVQDGQPGAVEGAAGSRYIHVPVTVQATQRYGSVRHFIGHYVLRRAVADGADDAQRAWRIASADLREVAR